IMLADTSNPTEPLVTFAKSGTLTANPENHSLQLTLVEPNAHTVSSKSPLEFTTSHNDSEIVSIDMPAAPAAPQKPAAAEAEMSYLWSNVRNGTATYE